MRSYGFTPFVGRRRTHLSLDFVDPDKLVLAWTTFDNPKDSKKEGSGYPSHLHAVFLNARTGQKLERREWPSSSWFASFYPVEDGNFIVCTGDAARLLSRNFDVLRERSLSNVARCSMSADKRSFAVRPWPSGLDSTLFDATSLEPLMTWSRKEARNVHFTAGVLVGNCKPDLEVCIRKLGQSWEPLNFAGIVDFLVNDSALVIGKGSELSVAELDGVSLFTMSLSDKMHFRSAAVSTAGDRLVVVMGRMRGLRNEELDMYPFSSDDHLVVYSLRTKRAVYARKLIGNSPWPGWEWGPHDHTNYLALSSDGTRLAIINDGILTVYSIPADKS